MEKLLLRQSVQVNSSRCLRPYTVIGVHNSVEWTINQRLTRNEVKEIITRRSVRQKELDVEITGSLDRFGE